MRTSKFEQEVVRPCDAVRILGISRATLYAWISKGKIVPPQKIGKSFTFWPRNIFYAWIDDTFKKSNIA